MWSNLCIIMKRIYVYLIIRTIIGIFDSNKNEILKKYEENDDLIIISRFYNGIILLLRSENRIIGDVLSDVKETIVFPYLNAMTHTELFKMIYEYRILCILSSIYLCGSTRRIKQLKFQILQHIINNHE